MSATYAAAARVLAELADRMAALADRTDLPDLRACSVQIGVLPCPSGPDADHARVVDIVGLALIGEAGRDRGPAGDARRYAVRDRRMDAVTVSVHASIPSREQEDMRAELARLRDEAGGPR